MAYFFLRAFADVHDLAPEMPRWIGQDFFGRLDDPITHAHPVILYDMVSEICQDSHHPMVTASFPVSRARAVREASGRRLVLLRDPLLTRPSYPLPATCLDLEGPYLLHTRHLSRHRELLRRVVAPIPVLHEGLEAGWRALRGRGDIVIGLHVRRGDFDSKFAHQGFEFVPPLQWYLSWLDEIWTRHKRPVLVVASDSLPHVLPALARYRPITTRDLGVKLPPDLLRLDLPPAHLQRDANFFPDWFMLTRCHALAISNSTFSFTASMLNETASVFVRPDPQANALVPFDPWDSKPLLFLPQSGNLLLEVLRRLSIAQRGIGVRATESNLHHAAALVRICPVGASDRIPALLGHGRPVPAAPAAAALPVGLPSLRRELRGGSRSGSAVAPAVVCGPMAERRGRSTGTYFRTPTSGKLVAAVTLCQSSATMTTPRARTTPGVSDSCGLAHSLGGDCQYGPGPASSSHE